MPLFHLFFSYRLIRTFKISSLRFLVVKRSSPNTFTYAFLVIASLKRILSLGSSTWFEPEVWTTLLRNMQSVSLSYSCISQLHTSSLPIFPTYQETCIL